MKIRLRLLSSVFALPVVAIGLASTPGPIPVAGDWTGMLNGKLPLILHLHSQATGQLSASLDSPAQGAYNLQAAALTLHQGVLGFTVPSVHGSYSGRIDSSGKAMHGSWTQGLAIPLDFVLSQDAATATPSPLVGAWNGTLLTPSGSLRLVFHLHSLPGGTLACALDSPDQNANDIPCSSVTFQANKLDLAVAAVHGTFQGTLEPGANSIDGTWSQGSPLPLVLKRATP